MLICSTFLSVADATPISVFGILDGIQEIITVREFEINKMGRRWGNWEGQWIKEIHSVTTRKFQTLQAETGLHVLTAKYTGGWGRSHQIVIIFNHAKKINTFCKVSYIILKCLECTCSQSDINTLIKTQIQYWQLLFGTPFKATEDMDL